MTGLRVVFLDRESLKVPIAAPRCASEYREFPATSADQVVERLGGATVAITNKVPLRAQTLAQLPQLRMIAIAATGYDIIDVPYCREHGIAVANVRGYGVHSVAEHTFALILALRRQLLSYREQVRAGEWQRTSQFCLFGAPIRDLNGSVLGLVGKGAIGAAVAALGTAFGMQVIFAARAGRKHDEAGVRTLDELLAQADVISLHCPLTEATRGLISEAQLRRMKPTAVLVNCSRGGLVDEAALARALTEGWIAGAASDVLTREPPTEGNPLLDLALPNFLLTPHVAWASLEAMRTLADQLIGNVDAWAAGKPRNLVT